MSSYRRDNQCPICKMLDSMTSEPCYIVEQQYSVTFLYSDQFYPGRTLVALKDHIENITQLDQQTVLAFYAEMLPIANAIQRVYKPDMLNYAMLGNRVRHLHWHIIPRYKKDGLWGKAPWPHARDYKSDEECRELAAGIREAYKEITYGGK